MKTKHKAILGFIEWYVSLPLFAYLCLRYGWNLRIQRPWLWLGLHFIQSTFILLCISWKNNKFKRQECGCRENEICSSCNPEEYYRNE